MLPDIYLDIDGVLLANDKTPANYSREFLKFVIPNFPVYWLTTHCRGNASTAVRRLEPLFEPEITSLLHRIKPTNWDVAKTEAINFNRPFLWFDDDLFEDEKMELAKNEVLENWIEVDLAADENRLADFLVSFPRPAGYEL